MSNSNFSILIIDDEEGLRKMLSKYIAAEGYFVEQAEDAKKAWKKLNSSSYHVVICDVKLPDENGVEMVKKIKEKYSETEVVLLTAFGNIQDGVQAIKNGAFDYLVKGDDNNKILPLLSKAVQKASLQFQLSKLQKQVNEIKGFDDIIGVSDVLKESIELAKKVAATNASVLLTGETGTGKEVFAQAIHASSLRHKQAIVALNCSAFSREILESELFGHKAGAFTGANRDKKGLIQEADGGTLFLDEIGEMHLDLQAKLLRVLESGEYLQVGDTKIRKADVRIIAATNKNVHREIEAGNFRNDLYYRLSAFEIKLPSLNERIEDIPFLTQHLIKLFSFRLNKKINGADPDFIKQLQKHHWKGNIRELKNVIERACILTPSDRLAASDLPYDFQFNTVPESSVLTLTEIEKLHIQKALHYTHGNKNKAAEILGIGVATLYRKLEQYKISS